MKGPIHWVNSRPKLVVHKSKEATQKNLFFSGQTDRQTKKELCIVFGFFCCFLNFVQTLILVYCVLVVGRKTHSI